MKKYNINGLLLICVIILMSACRKDSQEFTYQDINQVTITTDATSYTRSAGDSLVIVPALKESLPAGEDYTYEWKISAANISLTTQTLLSTDRNLRIKISQTPSTYNLIYNVVSKKTGVTYTTRVPLTVQATFFDGWYVANNRNGRASLSFIRTDDRIFENPAEDINKKTYTGKALSVCPSTTQSLLYFFTENNAYRFNPNDFLEITDRARTLPYAPVPYASAPILSHGTDPFGPYYQFIIVNGDLHMGMGSGNFFTNGAEGAIAPFSPRLTGDYKLFSESMIMGTNQLFYDNKYKRFMSIAFQDDQLVTAGSTGGSFNMANVGRTMIAADRGIIKNTTPTNFEFFFVMEDGTGVRYLMSLVNLVPGLNQVIGNSPDINNATSFATSSTLKNLYYAAGNKVYKYDMLNNSSILLYTFPGNYVIKDIEMQRSNSQVLAVAANNGASGEVYLFNIINFGEFEGQTYAKKYTGFGEIVNIKRR